VKVDSKGFAPSFGLGAGVEYFCNRNVSLSGQVKWNYTWDRQVSVAGTEYQGDLSLIHFQIGVRLYLFDVGGSKE
jgi:opacity protein-like surface antigen